MQGIEILDTYQEVVATGFGWSATGIVFLVLGAFSLVLLFIGLCNDEAFTPMVFIAVLACMIGFFASTADAKKTYETHYQIIVYEDCNLTEFLDTYEVVGAKGETWIVKDRNINED